MGTAGAGKTGKHVYVCFLGWAKQRAFAGARPRGHEAALLLAGGTGIRVRVGSEGAGAGGVGRAECQSRFRGFVSGIWRGDWTEDDLQGNSGARAGTFVAGECARGNRRPGVLVVEFLHESE